MWGHKLSLDSLSQLIFHHLVVACWDDLGLCSKLLGKLDSPATSSRFLWAIRSRPSGNTSAIFAAVEAEAETDPTVGAVAAVETPEESRNAQAPAKGPEGRTIYINIHNPPFSYISKHVLTGMRLRFSTHGVCPTGFLETGDVLQDFG